MGTIHYILIGVGVLLIALIYFSLRQAKKSSVKLTEEEFKQGMRKGQLTCAQKQNMKAVILTVPATSQRLCLCATIAS